MNLNHLAILNAVLEEGTISLGAERLHISQPAVSKQLKELESYFNTVLVDRHPKGIRPTEAGTLLGEYAKRIFSLEAQAELAIAELKGLARGHLVIGASLTTGNYLLPAILARFHRQYPAIEVSVEIANTETVQLKLIEGKFDIGLTEGYVDSAQLDSVIFAEDELVPVAPPEHRIFSKPSVTLDELCCEDFVLREHGSGTREVMERAIAGRGCTMKTVMSLGDIEAVKRAVAAGIGLGIVSIHALSMEFQIGTLRRVIVDNFVIRRPLHLLTLHNKYQTWAARAIIPMIVGTV